MANSYQWHFHDPPQERDWNQPDVNSKTVMKASFEQKFFHFMWAIDSTEYRFGCIDGTINFVQTRHNLMPSEKNQTLGDV